MTSVLNLIVSIVFHGFAYAMVLYVISVGLSLTMGMLNFVNLAHGVFAMAGGYGKNIQDTVEVHVQTIGIASTYARARGAAAAA